MGGDRDHAVAPACAYCRTGSAAPYLANRAANRRVGKEPSAHDPACPEYGPAQKAKEGGETQLYCQTCGQGRRGVLLHLFGRGINPRGGSWPLRCPRCDRVTAHHQAQREVVEAEECDCGACRMRRGFGVTHG